MLVYLVKEVAQYEKENVLEVYSTLEQAKAFVAQYEQQYLEGTVFSEVEIITMELK